MKKYIKIGVIGFIVLIMLVFLNPFAINDAGNRQVIQTFSGELKVKYDPGFYYAGIRAKITTWPNNYTIQSSDEAHRSPEADLWIPVSPLSSTFAEGDRATVSHTTKWDMPNVEAQMLELHTTYGSIENLGSTTLFQYQKQTASFSTQRMNSEAHYSGGESQLNEYFQDQLRNGQVLLETDTKTRKLEDGTEKTYIEVTARKDENGMVERNESDIQKYGIVASFASIDEVKYDDRIYEKLKAKIDAASDEATAKQQLITAQQEALTEKAKGEKLIAQTKAREESTKLQAVIRAEKEAAVAAQNLKRDKLVAASQLALKEAQAKGDRLKVAAGLTPQEKAEWEYKTAVGVAKEIFGGRGITFPSVMVNSDSKGGKSIDPFTAVGLESLKNMVNSGGK